MTDQQQDQPQKIEIETTKQIKGKVKWFGNPMNPVPAVLKNSLVAIRYGCTGLIVAFSGAPREVLTAQQSTVFAFWLGIIIILTGMLQLCIGVEPSK
jgi:hypothetical protein